MAVNDEVRNKLERYGGFSINQRVYNFLGDLGYTGTISDRLAKYKFSDREGWYALIQEFAGVGGFTPYDLFSQGQNGLWLDTLPTYLFEDSAGTISDVVNGDPTGLALDRHAGLTLGPELWEGQAGAVDNGAGGAVYTYDDPSKTLTVTTAGTNAGYPRLSYDLGLEAGKRYRVEGRLSFTGSLVLNSSVPVRLSSAGTDNLIGYNPGTGEFYGNQIADVGSIHFAVDGTTTGSVTLEELSVRELPGNHATQPTSADRPTYGTDGTLHWLTGNGSNWHLNLGQALNLETFTAVVACRVGGVDQRLLDNRGTGTPGSVPGWQIKARHDAVGDLVTIDDGAGNYWAWVDTVASSSGDVRVITVRYQQNDGLVRVNGDTLAPNAASASMGSILSPIDGNLFTASNSIGMQSFSGEFFGGVVTSDFLPIAEIDKLEKELAKKAGVTL